jgi:hypothetical protein
MKNALIIVAATILTLVVSIYTAVTFHWKFMEFIAMIAICVIVMVVALYVWTATNSKMNVGWVFFSAFALYLALYTGWSWNFAPKEHKFQACPIFYQIVQLPQPQEVGCTKANLKSVLNAREYYVANQSYGEALNKALDNDLEEAWRAEREGEFISPPFPRFQQAWGAYQAALANEASDRLTGNPDQKMVTGSVLLAIIFIGFLINGVAGLLGWKLVGGVQAVIGLLVVLGAWIGWGNPNLFAPFFPRDVSREIILIMEDYWNVGLLLGVIPQLLPFFGTVAGFAKGALAKWKWAAIVVPAFLLALGMFLSPNLVLVMMMPGINEAIIAHPELSITPIQLAITFGMLAGIGGVSFFEGLMSLIFGE